MKITFSRKVFEKYSKIEPHENLSVGSRGDSSLNELSSRNNTLNLLESITLN